MCIRDSVYLVPTFQNPTGRTLSLARRKQVAEILVRRDALPVSYTHLTLPTIYSV